LNVLCSQVGQVTNMWLRFRESRSRFEEVEWVFNRVFE
jgi:hypothetical protein